MSKLKLSALSLMACGMMAYSQETHAQFAPVIVDTGTVIEDLPLTDINGNKTYLYDYLDSGYTVAIELFLTTCPICWSFKGEGVFENVYQKYGPKGTVSAKKIIPLMIEMSPQTNSADMKGTGANTQGDWTKGTSYPIIDLTPNNERATMLRFLRNDGDLLKAVNTPTFMVICPDRKLVYSAEGAGAITEQMLVKLMENRCATSGGAVDTGKGTSISNVISRSSLHLYPNPTSNLVNVHLEAMSGTEATFSVVNMLGQTFVTENITLAQGIQTIPVNLGQLAPGIYILNIKTNQGSIQEKFVVGH